MKTPNVADIQAVIAKCPGNDLLELPVFEEILRESPESMADRASRSLFLPALTPLDEVSELYVWNVQADHLPEGLLPGDHVVIQWRKETGPRDLVGQMAVGYDRDGRALVGRIAPSDSDYDFHDGLPKGAAVSWGNIEICGVIRWAWREA